MITVIHLFERRQTEAFASALKDVRVAAAAPVLSLSYTCLTVCRL